MMTISTDLYMWTVAGVVGFYTLRKLYYIYRSFTSVRRELWELQDTVEELKEAQKK